MLGGMLGLVACASTPTNDGTSDEAFWASHARLVRSLTATELVELRLAEAVILVPLGCPPQEAPQYYPLVRPKPPELNLVLNEAFREPANLVLCRKYLHGMSYRAILGRAYARH
jgi:hypothetical protein